MRMLLVAALSLGSAVLALPLMVLAQSSTHESSMDNAAGKKFRAFLDEDWKRWMTEYPEMATSVGYPGQNRRWNDYSARGIESRQKHLREALAELKATSREALPRAEQLNYDIYMELLQTAEEGLKYGDDPLPFRQVVPFNNWMPLDQMNGMHSSAADTIATMPTHSVADYEDILARLEALPTALEQNVALMQEGLKKGYAPPKQMLRDVPKQIADLNTSDPLKSAMLAAFVEFPTEIPAGERTRLTARAKEIFSAKVAPALQKYHDYVTNTYIPACRESIAATALPNGAEAYAFHVRWQTTTDLTPAQIHEIGLSEVKRIRAEMDKVIASVNFKGSFHEFTEFLRNDPQFYYDKPDDLVNGYRVIAKRIDPELAH